MTVNADDAEGEDRNRTLATWERERRIATSTRIDGWDDEKARKIRNVYVPNVREIFSYDARQPYPPVDVFARIALALCAGSQDGR